MSWLGPLRRTPAMLRMAGDLLSGRYPSFVYARPSSPDELPPIFTFHETTADLLDPILAGLAEAGYQTLTCDEYLAAARGARPVDSTREVLLTFDDGHASVWSVVHPLLRRYGLRAVVYLIPGRVQEAAEPGAAEPLCTWRQIREMHEAGTLDFQSHTLFHQRVFTGSRIRDFVRPEHFELHPHDLLLWDGPDPSGEELPVRPSYPPPPLGAPLYASRPRMQADRALREDAAVRRACVDLVAAHGGCRFFERDGWRGRLVEVVRTARRAAGDAGDTDDRRETPAERDRALRADLERSRRMIERRLPGKQVRHLAWPWGVASEAAVEAARAAGYEACYWGRSPHGFRNRVGMDPMRFGRIGEDFLARLPGAGESGLARLLLDKFRRRTPGTGWRRGLTAGRGRGPSGPDRAGMSSMPEERT